MPMVSPDDGADKAVEQVNEAVEDGGGCTEAWEALSNLRKQDNSDRRTFLKGIGASGAGAFGLAVGTSSVSAEKSQPSQEVEQATNEEIERVLASPKTQKLLDHVENISINLDDAKKVTTTFDEQVTTFVIPSNFGDVFFGELADISEAGLAFGLSVLDGGFSPLSSEQREQLTTPFADLPNTPAVYVVDREGNTVQSRVATKRENDVYTKRLGASSDKISALLSTDAEDVITFAGAEDTPQYYDGRHLSPMPDDSPFRESTDDELADIAALPPRLQTMQNCNDRLGECAASVGAPAACIAGCVTAGVATYGAAFALCAICSGGTGFNAGIQCAQYYKFCL